MDGLKNDTLCVIIFAFLLAGILSQELRQSGLIQGLTWLVMKLGLSAGFLPLEAFLVCLLISTACGTSNRAIVAVLPVLLAVAAAVGGAAPFCRGSGRIPYRCFYSFEKPAPRKGGYGSGRRKWRRRAQQSPRSRPPRWRFRRAGPIRTSAPTCR